MEIVGDEILMSLMVSTVDGIPPEESLYVYTILHFQLDGATLDGTAHGTTTIYNVTNDVLEPPEAGAYNLAIQ